MRALLLPLASLVLTLSLPRMGRATELIDPAALGFGRPAFTVDATFQAPLSGDGLPGDVDLWEVRTQAPLAKWDAGDWLFGAGVGYAWTHADFAGAAGIGEIDLHQLKATLFLGWEREGSPWWALGFLTPGMASDFTSPGSDSFQAAGLALAGYHWSDSLDLAVGVFGSWSLGEATVLPAAGFIWRPTPQWTVQATPPIVAIGWQPADQWSFGLVAYPGGGAWEVGGSRDTVRQIDLTLWRAALSVERRFGPHWRLSVRGGVAFGGEVEFRDAASRVLVSADLDAAPFAAAAVKWAF